jgi:carbonic anhydrase
MDTRLSIRTLGLKTGDAHIIRNAGGIATEDTLRSLVVSHYLLGTEEIMVINHTDCGLMQTTEQDLRTKIQNRTGTAAVAPSFFYAFQDIEENGRHQLQKLCTHPWIPKRDSQVKLRLAQLLSDFFKWVSGQLIDVRKFRTEVALFMDERMRQHGLIDYQRAVLQGGLVRPETLFFTCFGTPERIQIE